MSSEMLFINHNVLFKEANDVSECQTFVSQGPFMITYLHTYLLTQADEAKIVYPPPLDKLLQTKR